MNEEYLLQDISMLCIWWRKMHTINFCRNIFITHLGIFSYLFQNEKNNIKYKIDHAWYWIKMPNYVNSTSILMLEIINFDSVT